MRLARVNNPGQARHMRVTLDNDMQVNDIMKNLNRLANVEDSLKQLWIHPDRSFKDRCNPESHTESKKLERIGGQNVNLVRGNQIIRATSY